MSGTLEHSLDFTLDMRQRRRSECQADLNRMERAVQASHAELGRRRATFSTEVRSLIRTVVEQANRHLTTRKEGCKFCESPGFSSGPWYPGKQICDPIAYHLQVHGDEVGENLVIELTDTGMIEARLWPLRLTDHRDQVAQIELGWSPIPLYSFDAKKAEQLLVLYLTVLTQRWRIGERT